MQSVHKIKISHKDGFEEYEIRFLNTTKSLEILARLNRMILGPLGTIVSNVKSDSASLLDSPLNIEGAFNLLANNMDEGTVVKTIKELTAVVRLGTGMEFNFDIHFEGRPMHLLKVVRAVLEVNYQDFFDELAGVAELVKKVMTPARQTGTGSSTAR